MQLYQGTTLTPEKAERRQNELEAVGDSRSFIFDVKYGKVEWSNDGTVPGYHSHTEKAERRHN